MVQFKSILVAVDFEEPSKHALEIAIDLAKQYGAALTLFHTWEIPPWAYAGLEFAPADLLTPVANAARESLATLLGKTRESLPAAASLLKQGVPWLEIGKAIEQTKADLVVIGTHGRHGLGRMVLGSVAEKVVRNSPVPVLTVRGRTASR